MVRVRHEPDCGRELAGKMDLSDVGAALASVAALQALIPLFAEGMRRGVDRGA